jgi:hypothetical protein
MLRKYSNHPPEEDGTGESRRKKWRGFLFLALALAILLFSGFALFSGRDALQRAYNHISTGVQAGLERHFPGRQDGRDILQRLKDMWPGGKPPAASPPVRLEGRDANVDQGTPARFLYTLELLDGGKIEGKSIEIGKEVITVTDDQGVVVQVNRDKVIRITKIRL